MAIAFCKCLINLLSVQNLKVLLYLRMSQIWYQRCQPSMIISVRYIGILENLQWNFLKVLVSVFDQSRGFCNWRRPYEVVSRVNSVMYELRDLRPSREGKIRFVGFEFLRPFNNRSGEVGKVDINVVLDANDSSDKSSKIAPDDAYLVSALRTHKAALRSNSDRERNSPSMLSTQASSGRTVKTETVVTHNTRVRNQSMRVIQMMRISQTVMKLTTSGKEQISFLGQTLRQKPELLRWHVVLVLVRLHSRLSLRRSRLGVRKLYGRRIRIVLSVKIVVAIRRLIFVQSYIFLFRFDSSRVSGVAVSRSRISSSRGEMFPSPGMWRGSFVGRVATTNRGKLGLPPLYGLWAFSSLLVCFRCGTEPLSVHLSNIYLSSTIKVARRHIVSKCLCVCVCVLALIPCVCCVHPSSRGERIDVDVNVTSTSALPDVTIRTQRPGPILSSTVWKIVSSAFRIGIVLNCPLRFRMETESPTPFPVIPLSVMTK